MNFGLSETQRAFEKLARDFLDRECDSASVRQAEESESGFHPPLHRKLAEQGFLGLNLDDDLGGSGAGYTEMVLFCLQAGRHLLPGPLVSLLTAAEILGRHGTPDQKARILPALASGEALPLPAWLEGAHDSRFETRTLESTATREGEHYRLRGEKRFVPFGSSATHLLWLAGTGKDGNPAAGSTLFLLEATPGSIRVTDYPTQGGSRVSDLLLEESSPGAESIGPPQRGWEILSEGLELGRLATAAYALGAAERSLEMGVEYASGREQFGRPIGSFQAIQHKLATCRCLIEQARWLTFHGAGLMDGGALAGSVASMAKLAACRAFRETSTASSLVHGGYGFMQEYDIQLYFRRAKEVENWCGSLFLDYECILESGLEAVG